MFASLLLGSVRAAVSINYARSARLSLGFLLGYHAHLPVFFAGLITPNKTPARGIRVAFREGS